MMQQAGCAAAGSASDDDDDDDVQVVDAGPAAEVADDVDAQLQQLEDGECELVLVKYVPGRYEQPDVQLLQASDHQQKPGTSAAALKLEAPAAAASGLASQQGVRSCGGRSNMY
jgi:hypothetical protein